MTDRIDAIAALMLDTLDGRRQMAPMAASEQGFELDDAYRVTARVTDMRRARGETPIGRKLGFTNRTIWDEYNVYAPIWGYVYDTTVREINPAAAAFDLARVVEPRIEPEITLSLKRAPEVGMDERALLGCVDWVAHGFEIVQSLFPGWRFTAPDTVAAFGLHGALLLGPRHAITPENFETWLAELSSFEVALYRGGEE
ncbi:MAG: 2-keto-4-pentenoate hydratase, partial [Hyphomicrobium sp.]